MAEDCDTGIQGIGEIPWGSHFFNRGVGARETALAAGPMEMDGPRVS